MGQTGSGKSALAEALAAELGAKLVNADAFMVYRGLDIGTNKPTDRSLYSLIDLVDPTEGFGVGQWVPLAHAELVRSWAEGRSVVMVGGTGLYVRALTEGYAEMSRPPDPELRAELQRREAIEGLESLVAELLQRQPDSAVDTKNPVRVRRALERLACGANLVAPKRLEFPVIKIAPTVQRNELWDTIERRAQSMFESGWPAEVQQLLESGVPITSPGFRAIGYQSVSQHVSGELSKEACLQHIVLKTRQYAKRQKTWLAREPGLHELPLAPCGSAGLQNNFRQAIEIICRRGETKRKNG